MLELIGCAAAYGDTPVFADVSLSLAPPQVVSIVGPSGCGKTTLLALIAGLKAASAGSIRLDGLPLACGDPRLGLILQHFGLFPWLTVEQNVELGLKLRRRPAADRRRRCGESLARAGLGGLERRYPAQLSGGQRQRVAIARTLALEPELLLMDEPFSALDALAREELQDLTLSLLATRPVMTLLVTHSIEEAVYLSDTVLLMGRGPASRIAARIDHREPGRRCERTSTEFFEACRGVRLGLEAILGA